MTGPERELALKAIDEAFADAVKAKFSILATTMTTTPDAPNFTRFAAGLQMLSQARKAAMDAL